MECVVRMVVDSIMPHAASGPNAHRKDAPQFTILSHLPCGIENFKIPFTRDPIRNRTTAIACNIIHRVPDNLLSRKGNSPNKINFKFRSATFDIWVWIVTKFQNSLSNISLLSIIYASYDMIHTTDLKRNLTLWNIVEISYGLYRYGPWIPP